MTLREARRRLRQTSTPERIVRVRRHEDACPARHSGDLPMTCRCVRRPQHSHHVVLDSGRRRR